MPPWDVTRSGWFSGQYARVHLADVLDEGLVALWYARSRLDDDDKALWSRTKLRKHFTCPISGRKLAPGDAAFSPVGNQEYRGDRIAPEVVEALVARGETW